MTRGWACVVTASPCPPSSSSLDKSQAKLTGKSITVVSVVGETVRLSWRGTTVFNNEFGEARVSDWGLRTRVEDRAVAMLGDSIRVGAPFSQATSQARVNGAVT